MGYNILIEIHADNPEDIQRLWSYLKSQGYEGGLPRDPNTPIMGQGLEDAKATYTRPIYLRTNEELEHFREHLKDFSSSLGFGVIQDKQRFLHNSDYGFRLVDKGGN
jgi:hypothetical protein